MQFYTWRETFCKICLLPAWRKKWLDLLQLAIEYVQGLIPNIGTMYQIHSPCSLTRYCCNVPMRRTIMLFSITVWNYTNVLLKYPSLSSDLKRGYTLPAIENVNLYQLMCRILRITAAPNNGTWSNIEEAFIKVPYRPLITWKRTFTYGPVLAAVLVAAIIYYVKFRKHSDKHKEVWWSRGNSSR